MGVYNLTEHFGTPPATSTEVMWTCGLCSVEMPQVAADEHRCKLNAKQRRRLDQWNKDRAAARAAAVAPRPCDWCREDVTPGVAHYCAPPTQVASAAIGQYQAAEVVALLESAGYTVSRSGN